MHAFGLMCTCFIETTHHNLPANTSKSRHHTKTSATVVACLATIKWTVYHTLWMLPGAVIIADSTTIITMQMHDDDKYDNTYNNRSKNSVI